MIDQQQQLNYFPMEMKCTMNKAPAVGGHTLLPPTNENNNNLNNVINNNAGSTGANSSANSNSCSTGKTSTLQATCSPVQSTTAVTTPPCSVGVSALGASLAERLVAAVGVGATVDALLAPASMMTTGSVNTVATLCGQCCSPICDRYIMKVVDIPYHERCLQCNSCAIRLMHSCFMRDGKLYCRFDYERLYGRNRCLGCGEKISADELVMRALDNVFHLKCFICVVCGVRLQKGDQYVIKQSQLFCRPDYEKEVEMLQGYNYDDYCCDDIFQTRIDGRRGPKRPRTILTTQQRRAFKASFEVSPKPCRKIREGLAKDTGLSIRIVQVWFQNQRAKMKKMQKKQLKEGNKGGQSNANKGNDSQDELSENETKLSLKIKDENSRSNNYLPDSCSDTEGGINDNDSFGSRISSGAEAFKPVKEEVDMDEEYFRMMSAATRFVGKNFEDTSNVVKSENIPLSTMMGMEYPSLQQLTTSMNSPHVQLLNPIDRLYSMQNSYFCNPDGGNPVVSTGCGNNGTEQPPSSHLHHHPHHPMSSTLHHNQVPSPNAVTRGPGPHPIPPGPHNENHGHPLHTLQQHHSHYHQHHQS
ncbi:LIM homeobox transcription factor 1-beta isoform X2 [Toxorhynchites rutilus septentrionalis]|uniref:LIM homeobox transcription factor 1-beta isoform X2 n=1 Tax=Toxorhynchites rutilus septentrionalis TaxID=329112 RepID=UPI002478B38B|nr:LIM homeobox transcription factor 1-beta isoform X2 [Toxorhynchites rutilus septentrionalis]